MSREKKYIYAKKIWVKKYKINKNPLSPTKGGELFETRLAGAAFY